jgi:hypothetical protein
MKAAIVTAPGTLPTFGDFPTPVAREGLELVTVSAATVSNLTKSRAAGSHYSSENEYPFIPGVDGVGRRRVFERTALGFTRVQMTKWRGIVTAAPFTFTTAFFT